MTGTDLRSAIDEELRDLEPMPTVLPEVLAEGAARRRRRRKTGIVLAAAAVTGIVGLGATTVPGVLDPGPEQRDAATATTGDKREFLHWAAGRLDVALPDRVGTVRVLEKGDNHDLVVDADGMRIEMDLALHPADTPHSPAEGDVYIPLTCFQTGNDNCATAPGGDAIVYRQNGGYYSSGNSIPSASMNVDLRGRSEVADSTGLYLYGQRPPAGPVPVTDQELFDVAGSPEFESVWREYAAHPEWIEPVDDDPRIEPGS